MDPATAYAIGMLERQREEGSIYAMLQDASIISERVGVNEAFRALGCVPRGAPKRRVRSSFFKSRPSVAPSFLVAATSLSVLGISKHAATSLEHDAALTIQRAASRFIALMRRRHAAAFTLQSALHRYVQRNGPRNVIANLHAQHADPYTLDPDRFHQPPAVQVRSSATFFIAAADTTNVSRPSRICCECCPVSAASALVAPKPAAYAP